MKNQELFDNNYNGFKTGNPRHKDVERQPLAERVRPEDLGSFIGQEHLLGEGKALKLIIESGHLPSMILWGPPGCGKTSLARILAGIFNYSFHSFSAVVSGIRELKQL